MGGYFFCSDSTATINVANAIISTNVSNTVMIITPFQEKGSESPPMKSLITLYLL